MTIGVVLVTYNASDVIESCLESLLASEGADLRIVVVDNASSDGTPEAVRAWSRMPGSLDPEGLPFVPADHGPVPLVEGDRAIARLQRGEVGLLVEPENLGFAGGVNAGLRALQRNTEVDHFWILNPDCMTLPGTAALLEACAAATGRYGAIGGRVFYTSPPEMIQNDGGEVSLWTGVCRQHNIGAIGRETPAPDRGRIDYLSGAHMMVSRTFLEEAGQMPEDYFLYYEEVDWCLRRGDLPLLFEVDAAVCHHAGHTIGSATLDKGPSELSAYFFNRARTKFVRRHNALALPLTLAYGTARALRSMLRGQGAAGRAALRGTWGVGPTPETLAKIGRPALPDAS